MDLKKIADVFFSSFHSNHVLLYIGQNANDDEIKRYISQCPWSGIITSRRDPDLGTFFVNNDRSTYEYNYRAEIPVKPLHRKKLPILRLFGVQGEKAEDEDLSWLWTDFGGQEDPTYNMNRAREMLQLLPDLLDHVNPLVIIGATSDIDWKLFGTVLTPLLYKAVSDGSVSIWDMPMEVSPGYFEAHAKLKRVAELKKFGFYDCSLAKAIQLYQDENKQYSEESPLLIEQNNDVYYQGQMPIGITPGELLLFKNVGTLLTERTINKIRPLGRILNQKYFSNFLEYSATLGPQWYGYLPQSTFYVKRSYEDALVHLVRKMLNGRGVSGERVINRPIVLAGDPGSSKSITLGALAYRIYNERVNPVIYISQDSFLSANIGTRFDELDNAMQLIEQKADVDTRILVIWDSSAYRTGIEQIHMLLERLQNRGRRFVLVCSSYNICTWKNEDQVAYYRFVAGDNSGKFEPCDKESAQILDYSDFYFVKAIREMNSQEQFEFWKRAKDYSGISDTVLSQFKKKFTAENSAEKYIEIFDVYYCLITILRENLEQGLKSEQSKVFPYVEQELQRVIGEIHFQEKEEKKLSPIYQAFLAAGFDPGTFLDDSISIDSDGTEQYFDEEGIDKNLEIFNMCVALFSRFKLTVPYGLAYTILVGENATERYSEGSLQLFRIVTSEIPWLHYGEDENGDFSFRFRNPLEADIFLRNHDITGEQQISLLCRIIDIYGTDYRRSKCKDLSFTDNLQALLRLLGPNSSYTPFRESGRQYEYNSILEKLDYLIDKLEDLRTVYGVPDKDAGFASIIVTFTREYYSFIWNKVYLRATSLQEPWETNPEYFSVEQYIFRLEKLISAIALAEHSVDEIEQELRNQECNQTTQQHLINQRCSLVVEIAQCNMRLEDLADEYLRCCNALGVKPQHNLLSRRLPYPVLYQQLYSVISSKPTNGYAYNTLFRAFRKMYERASLSESQKFQYLSEIMQVVETCETLDSEIMNRGSRGTDELTLNINSIKDICTGYQISLESIQRHRNGEAPVTQTEQICFDLYDEMLKANNAAAITFICQKELRLPKGTNRLNTDQLLRCRNIYNFMQEKDNFECIRSNAYALAMMIRVYWMLHNETMLTNSPECQLTKLNHQQWVELNRLCAMYTELAGKNVQPLIVLLYALSALQMSNLSEYGYHEALDILGTLNEDIFFQRRMWTPFILCDDTGTPYEFSGTVLSVKANSGFIQVYGVPRRLKKDLGVRFRKSNLGRNISMPEPKQVLNGLELGIGYTNFSVYTHIGRKEKEVRL